MPGKVVVASGGRSLEREVSLRSGGRAADALGALGYEVTVIDPDARFVRRIRELEPDFVFVAMHGRGGEDGTLQDLLEILGVPYTGSDVHASGRCLDKHSFKQLMQAQGLDTPEWHSFNREAFSEFGAAESLDQLAEPARLPVRAEAGAAGLLARDQVRRDARAVRPRDRRARSTTTTAC